MRLLRWLVSFFIGRWLFSVAETQSSRLLEIPMQRLRQITRLWMWAFGSLLTGVVALGLVLVQVVQQLQVQPELEFTGALGFAIAVTFVSFGITAFSLREPFWQAKAEKSKPEMDLLQAASQWLAAVAHEKEALVQHRQRNLESLAEIERERQIFEAS